MTVHFWYSKSLNITEIAHWPDRIYSNILWKLYQCFLLPLAYIFLLSSPLFLHLTSFTIPSPGWAIIQHFTFIFSLYGHEFILIYINRIMNIPLFSALFSTFEVSPCCCRYTKSLRCIISVGFNYAVIIHFPNGKYQILY